MVARRSNRLAGRQLGNDFIEIIARSAIETHRETHAFRLLDLPPELREFIYAYATVTEHPWGLESLRLPAIALVSKQIRAEVLPLFFAQQLFENENRVLSNYSEAKPISEQRDTLEDLDAVSRVECLSADEKRRETYGYLRDTNISKETLEELRKGEQYLPLFRNLRMRVVTGFFRGKQIKMEGSLFPDELARTLERVRGKSDEIAKSQDRFLGFTFEDLEAIVKEFCFCYDSV
ncbi:hypothetical protein LTR17_016056 [Elasticomyces elasticus]|nr:hypothetical protein LTR17_016056 [Elasticomyces elasticus]